MQSFGKRLSVEKSTGQGFEEENCRSHDMECSTLSLVNVQTKEKYCKDNCPKPSWKKLGPLMSLCYAFFVHNSVHRIAFVGWKLVSVCLCCYLLLGVLVSWSRQMCDALVRQCAGKSGWERLKHGDGRRRDGRTDVCIPCSDTHFNVAARSHVHNHIF